MATITTSPKPFVFVLMPFDSAFDDIYTFGIKGAAQDVGAYAERVDEQVYEEGILERIFNQINKADVIVADMTGRNANVFYEVGYAHALNKIVLLVTQSADDIPFDLKHRQHSIYGGRIDDLRHDLSARLRWAIHQSQDRAHASDIERFAFYLDGKPIARAEEGAGPTFIAMRAYLSDRHDRASARLRFAVRNEGSGESAEIKHVYMFAPPAATIYPLSKLGPDNDMFERAGGRLAVPARPDDIHDGLSEQFQLKGQIPSLPVGGVHTGTITFEVYCEKAVRSMRPLYEGESRTFTGDQVKEQLSATPVQFRMRLMTHSQHHDFVFVIDPNTIVVSRADTSFLIPPFP